MNRSWLNLPGSPNKSHRVSGPLLMLVAVLLTMLLTMRSAPAQAPQPASEPAAAEANANAPASEPAAGTEATTGPAVPPPGVNLPAPDPVESNFADFLHFALMGQFDIAESHAQALLKLPGMHPLSKENAEKLLRLSEKYSNSIETLTLLISNTPLSKTAQQILDLVREAHRQARMSPERILANIRLLSGTPVQQAVALERLRESGEYAVPWMLQTLADPKEQNLFPFIVRALPLLGKKAVNPLVEALSIDNPVVRGVVAEALGRIGYPQALPYLQRVLVDPKANEEVKRAASEAIKRIVVTEPALKNRPPAESFRDLAEQYYADTESLRPDPTEPRANVWFLRENVLTPIEVPPQIFRFVMAMRTARASLALDPNQPQVVALWLAANIHREAALGLDVTSEEVVPTADRTRPEDFPRSIYFARTFGPMHDQIALARAIRDRDIQLALGVIAALNVTAGPAAMVEPGPEGASLAAALRFPDLLVRIRAALALARAMPQKAFREAGDVVPVLASAVQLTGKKNYMVVEPDTALRTRLQEDLRRGGAQVVAAETFSAAMDEAHRKLTHLDGVFLSTDALRPAPVDAVRELKADQRFGLTPVVLLVKPNGNLVADHVAEVDRRVGRVFLVTDGQTAQANLAEQLVARRNQIAPKFGLPDITPELSLSLALDAARTLRMIAVNRSPVFDIRGAESALAGALANPSEELRLAAAAALAMIDTPGAQRAIAAVALAADQSEALRKAAFADLADSARQFGAKLDEATTRKLTDVAVRDPNLAIRTAASQALGAMNLPGKSAAEIILSQPQ